MAGQLKRDDGVHNKPKVKEIRLKIQILANKENNRMFLTLRQTIRSKITPLQSYVSDEKDIKA